ncbi:MAG: hypothetical protein FWE76_00380 [Symbiobacteriaceae bacterium]|nr:hypothetical protein [Symbiobacteriaceae bacterium]
MARINSESSLFGRSQQQQIHTEDCDMLLFCEKNAQTYRLCYRGTPLSSKRCSPAEKNMMHMFSEVAHRVQLIEDTINNLNNDIIPITQNLTSLAQAQQTGTETKRFEQSQAASLLVSPGEHLHEASDDTDTNSDTISRRQRNAPAGSRIIRS